MALPACRLPSKERLARAFKVNLSSIKRHIIRYNNRYNNRHINLIEGICLGAITSLQDKQFTPEVTPPCATRRPLASSRRCS